MNRKKALVSFVIVAMLLCGPLVFPVRATPSDWSKPRPSTDTDYYETIGNSKTDGSASMALSVEIVDYVLRGGSLNYDMLRLRVTTSANTRMGIQYQVLEEDYIYDWCEGVSEPTGITGDNDGALLDLGFNFLYYGVEYREVWVCSNGFITLNKTSTNANPQSIPSMDEPNPIIAVFWRDLHFGEGSSITYSRDVYFDSRQYLVVSWNNVLDDSGNPQTFQVLIQNRQAAGCDFHNDIFFQYESITKSYPTTVGTEDQVGNKGTAYDYNNLHNQACLRFEYPIQGCRLEQLKIKLTKSDSYARIIVEEDETGGCNVNLKDDSNPWWADDFEFAIKTTATLLLLKAGIMWKVMLIVAEGAGVLANDLSPVKPEYTQDALEGDPEAWAYGDCEVENRPLLKPFDSTLATTILWKLTDANNRDHDLTVTAEAWYRDLSNDLVYIVPTSVTLNMYIINSPPNTPSKPSGPTSGYVYTTYYYSTSTIDPDGDDVRYEFSWGDGTSNTVTDLYASEATASAQHSWSGPGTHQVQVRAQDVYGLWSGWSNSLGVSITQNDAGTGGDAGNSLGTATLISTAHSYKGTVYPADENDYYKFYAASGQNIEVSMTPPSGCDFDLQLYDPNGYLKAGSYYPIGYTDSVSYTADSNGSWTARIYIWSGEGQYSFYVLVEGSGGCPMLYVYDGTGYFCEGLLDIHNPDGVDVVFEHTLVSTPQRVDGAYLMRLTEHPQTHSFIDQVKLYAVLEDGTVMELPLIWACHSEDGNVLPQLLHSDEWKADTLGADHNDGTSQSIDLKFAVLSPNLEIVGFVFQIEGNNAWEK